MPPIMAQTFVIKCENDFEFSVIRTWLKMEDHEMWKHKCKISLNGKKWKQHSLVAVPALEKAHNGTLQQEHEDSELNYCEQCTHTARSMYVHEQILWLPPRFWPPEDNARPAITRVSSVNDVVHQKKRSILPLPYKTQVLLCTDADFRSALIILLQDE